MTAKDTSGGDGGSAIPDWIFDLKPLVAVTGFLVALANNPVETLREFVIEIVLVWAVGGLVDLAAQVLALVYDGILLAADAPIQLAEGMIDAGAATGQGVLEVIFVFAELVSSLAASLGPLGPIVVVVVIAGVGWLLKQAVASRVPGGSLIARFL